MVHVIQGIHINDKTFSNGNTFHMKVNRLKPKTNILEGVQTKVHTYKSADSELPPLAHNNSLKFSVTMSMGYAVHSTPCNMSIKQWLLKSLEIFLGCDVYPRQAALSCLHFRFLCYIKDRCYLMTFTRAILRVSSQ